MPNTEHYLKFLLADVDTPEPDEKSIITYVSQLYDVFPEPPPGHPLFDVEAQKRLQQFRDLASSLHQWIKEQIVVMQVRVIPHCRGLVCLFSEHDKIVFLASSFGKKKKCILEKSGVFLAWKCGVFFWLFSEH